MANENQPGNAPQHQSSQIVPPGNQTNAGTNSQPLEKQMLELARREKETRKLQESLKGAVTIESLRERGKADRNSVLKELGFDDLIQEDANDPIAALRKQIEDMKNLQDSKEKEAQDAREFEDFKAQFGQKPDDTEIVSRLGLEKQVFDAVRAHQSEHGEMPDMYQIAKELEDVILQQVTSLKGSKKLSDLFKSDSAPTQAKHPLDQGSTLTHSDRTSTQQATDSAPTMSRQQMIEQASKLIKFND